MVDPTRSKIMRSIRSKDTRPEIYIRKLVHRSGLRFRLHYPTLPGKPDIVFPKYQAVILVNGCFWHGHTCHIYNPSKRRSQSWEEKIEKNRQRDQRNSSALLTEGWRVLVVWECALQGKTRIAEDRLAEEICSWVKGTSTQGELAGDESN